MYFDLKQESELNLPKFDILIHLAYYKNASYKEEKKINIQGSIKLFKLAKKINAKIIYISSQSADQFSKSNYGKVKFYLENLAKEYKAFILRPGLVYKKDSNEGLFGNLEFLIKKFPIIIAPSGLNKKINLCNLNSVLEKVYDVIINNLNNSYSNLFENKKFTLNELLNHIALSLNKKIIIIKINYRLVFYFLKITEMLNFKISLKSDSIKSLIQ